MVMDAILRHDSTKSHSKLCHSLTGFTSIAQEILQIFKSNATDNGLYTKGEAMDSVPPVPVTEASSRLSFFVQLMRSVDEHGKASCADDLFFTLMIAGEVYPGHVFCTTDKTFELFVCHSYPSRAALISSTILFGSRCASSSRRTAIPR